MGETWSTVDPRVTQHAAAANSGGNKVAVQAPGNPNAGTIGGTAKRRVHCWTGDPTWRRHISRDKDRDTATDHAGSDQVQEIPYIHAFTDFLSRAGILSSPFDFLDFHTHGAGGFVAFEKAAVDSKVVDGKEVLVTTNEDGIGWMNIFRLDGHDAAFNRGASIEFHGCNVSEGFEGEVFLYEVCARLLPKGGKVGASTGVGLSWGWNWADKGADKGNTHHPFGDWVTWESKPENGSANMVGTGISFFHKVPQVIEESKKRLEAVVSRRTSTMLPEKSADQKPGDPTLAVRFSQFVAAARKKLKLDAPSETPARLDICWGRAYIDAAEAILAQGYRPRFGDAGDPTDPAVRWAAATQRGDDMAIAVLYAMNDEPAPSDADGSGDSDDAFAIGDGEPNLEPSGDSAPSADPGAFGASRSISFAQVIKDVFG